ncbi:hypothetical protein EVAR_19218_1 [Eumeta japonica]|uniref:Endonuclease/exonuclease/phosphatase domain-containing protein n=1 Tax=Eumeta variegata TaxID=151549 RepID=A0A4C1VEQ3_EUMVA|nr:hypothetical protein EVAR_19218_1 [Eumeta japonica]
MSDDGLDCTASNKKTEQSIALNDKNACIPESVTSALHTVINYENETVIYSDELGIGLGPMLSGYMNHRVTNICMPGTTSSNLVLSITRLLAPSAERSIRGGSLILIRNNLKFKERKDIVSLSVERVIEIACVELERLVVMSVYRPPHSSYELFESVMDQALCKISDKSKQIAICGDFNVDLLDASNRGGEILEFFGCYNLSNLFLVPTRISSTCETCIDNIYTNIEPQEKFIIRNLKSDHSGQFVSLEYRLTKS